MLRVSPDAARFWAQASEEIQSPFSLGPDRIDGGSSGAEKNLQFFAGALEYAIFPHARSPMFAKSFGVENRDMAWGWITDQITKKAAGANWIQAPNLSKIADISARTMELVGQRRFPLRISKSQAEKWFLIWRMLNEQRVARNGWTFCWGPARANCPSSLDGHG